MIEGIHWIAQEEYDKAIGQLRLQLNGVFEPFRMYGLDAYIPGAQGEVIRLAEDFSLRIRGVDKPISLESVRKKRRKK